MARCFVSFVLPRMSQPTNKIRAQFFWFAGIISRGRKKIVCVHSKSVCNCRQSEGQKKTPTSRLQRSIEREKFAVEMGKNWEKKRQNAMNARLKTTKNVQIPLPLFVVVVASRRFSTHRTLFCFSHFLAFSRSLDKRLIHFHCNFVFFFSLFRRMRNLENNEIFGGIRLRILHKGETKDRNCYGIVVYFRQTILFLRFCVPTSSRQTTEIERKIESIAQTRKQCRTVALDWNESINSVSFNIFFFSIFVFFISHRSVFFPRFRLIAVHELQSAPLLSIIEK